MNINSKAFDDQIDADLIRFYKDVLIFDIHIHGKDIFSSPIQFLSRFFPLKNLFHPLSSLSVLRRGGVDGGVLCVIGDRILKHLNRLPGSMHRVHRQLYKFERDVKESNGLVVFTSQEILRAKQHNVFPFVLGLEGAGPIEENFENLERLLKAGIRLLTIIHFNDNEVGTTTVDFIRYLGKGKQQKSNRGLTSFGEKIVRKMNDLGMIVDLSHADYETVMDVTSLAKRPVIASHTGAHAVSYFHRYITDDEIKAIAYTGGVVGLWPMYLFGKGMAGPKDFMAHVKHILALVGEDHLAIGTDYQGVPSYMNGYNGITDMLFLTQILFRMGLTETQVKKILGLNFLRVLKEVTGN